LHLTENPYLGRTGRLLFIKIIDNKVYFLNIKNHKSFSSINFIKIMHNNWKEEIKIYNTTEYVKDKRKLNENEIFSLWNKGINAILTFIDDNNEEVSYYPISAGINSNKTKTVDTIKWIKFLNILEEIDKNLCFKCYLRLDTENSIYYIEDESNNILF